MDHGLTFQMCLHSVYETAEPLAIHKGKLKSDNPGCDERFTLHSFSVRDEKKKKMTLSLSKVIYMHALTW